MIKKNKVCIPYKVPEAKGIIKIPWNTEYVRDYHEAELSSSYQGSGSINEFDILNNDYNRASQKEKQSNSRVSSQIKNSEVLSGHTSVKSRDVSTELNTNSGFPLLQQSPQHKTSACQSKRTMEKSRLSKERSKKEQQTSTHDLSQNIGDLKNVYKLQNHKFYKYPSNVVSDPLNIFGKNVNKEQNFQRKYSNANIYKGHKTSSKEANLINPDLTHKKIYHEHSQNTREDSMNEASNGQFKDYSNSYMPKNIFPSNNISDFSPDSLRSKIIKNNKFFNDNFKEIYTKKKSDEQPWLQNYKAVSLKATFESNIKRKLNTKNSSLENQDKSSEQYNTMPDSCNTSSVKITQSAQNSKHFNERVKGYHLNSAPSQKKKNSLDRKNNQNSKEYEINIADDSLRKHSAKKLLLQNEHELIEFFENKKAIKKEDVLKHYHSIRFQNICKADSKKENTTDTENLEIPRKILLISKNNKYNSYNANQSSENLLTYDDMNQVVEGLVFKVTPKNPENKIDPNLQLKYNPMIPIEVTIARNQSYLPQDGSFFCNKLNAVKKRHKSLGARGISIENHNINDNQYSNKYLDKSGIEVTPINDQEPIKSESEKVRNSLPKISRIQSVRTPEKTKYREKYNISNESSNCKETCDLAINNSYSTIPLEQNLSNFNEKKTNANSFAKLECLKQNERTYLANKLFNQRRFVKKAYVLNASGDVNCLTKVIEKGKINTLSYKNMPKITEKRDRQNTPKNNVVFDKMKFFDLDSAHKLTNYNAVKNSLKKIERNVSYVLKNIKDPNDFTENDKNSQLLENQKKLHSRFVTPHEDCEKQEEEFEKFRTQISTYQIGFQDTVRKGCRYYMRALHKAMKKESDEYFGKMFRDHFATNFNHLNSIETQNILSSNYILPTYVTFLDIFKTKLFPPKTPRKQKVKNKKLLLLDQDDTLIHCKTADEVIPGTKEHCNMIKLKVEGIDEMLKIYVYCRPYLEYFLKTMNEYYDVAIFAGSDRLYAKQILKFIDPHRNHFIGEFFREHCVIADNGYIIKDLRIFRERDLSQIIIVDNAATCFYNNLENGVPIIPYHGNKKDTQLLDQAKILIDLSTVDDVRTYLPEIFCLNKYLDHNNFDELCNDMFEKFIDYSCWIYS